MPRSTAAMALLSWGLALVVAGLPARANCAGPGAAPVDLLVRRCRPISPSAAPVQQALARSQGPVLEASSVRRLFTGALLTDSEGLDWTYPIAGREPCHLFPPGTQLRRMAFISCCDTGAWGTCLLGGRFLGDRGGPPIPVFQ